LICLRQMKMFSGCRRKSINFQIFKFTNFQIEENGK